VTLPVCDHYSGVEARMRKSLQLQAEMAQEFGACVFDVTLDCEDGAPGGRRGRACRAGHRTGAGRQARHARVAVRVHPVDHPAFAPTCTIAGRAGARLSHVMVPKVESVADVDTAAALDAAGADALPLHVLIESPRRCTAPSTSPRIRACSRSASA
jgi:citrate lyase subunit beta/citryl-CoA lyase